MIDLPYSLVVETTDDPLFFGFFEGEDVLEALAYAAWRSEEKELPLVS